MSDSFRLSLSLRENHPLFSFSFSLELGVIGEITSICDCGRPALDAGRRIVLKNDDVLLELGVSGTVAALVGSARGNVSTRRGVRGTTSGIATTSGGVEGVGCATDGCRVGNGEEEDDAEEDDVVPPFLREGGT